MDVNFNFVFVVFVKPIRKGFLGFFSWKNPIEYSFSSRRDEKLFMRSMSMS